MIIRSKGRKIAINNNHLTLVKEPLPPNSPGWQGADEWIVEVIVGDQRLWLFYDTGGEAQEAWEKLATALA